MLKAKLTKVEYEALNEALKSEYKGSGDVYLLDAEGLEDVTTLRRAKEQEARIAKELREENERLKAEKDTATDDAARKQGDVKALEDSYKTKLAKQKEQADASLALKDKQLNSLTVDAKATELATELAGDSAHLLVPFIKQRLQADLTGDKPITRVIDADGKPTAMSVNELKEEFAIDTRYAAVIIASRASGGGAAGGSRNGGTGATTKKPFKEMNDAERTDLWHKNPDLFKQEVQKEEAALRGV